MLMEAQAAEALADEEEYEIGRRHLSAHRASSCSRELELGYPVRSIDRTFLPNFDFGRCVLVVVVGPDGLVANTAKYVGDLPIIGVNPDPRRNDGVLLPFRRRPGPRGRSPRARSQSHDSAT